MVPLEVHEIENHYRAAQRTAKRQVYQWQDEGKIKKQMTLRQGYQIRNGVVLTATKVGKRRDTASRISN
jgi:CTP-dependent riboflavin kinase